jgi:DNA-binding transcriptional LysR family regulator
VNLRQLEYVIAIAEAGSFTAAAERCHTAQSALSHQIASLERGLGTKLFDRTSRSVRLTEAGRLLLPVARRVLEDLEDVRAELHDMNGLVRGPLRIGATQTSLRRLNFPQLFADYSRHYPDVQFALTVGPSFELLAELRSGSLDVALTAVDGAVPRDLAYSPVGSAEMLVAVVSQDHPLASRLEVRLGQLADTSRFIDFRAHTALWNKVLAMSEDAGIERQVVCELGNVCDMVRLAGTGLGAAIVPRIFTVGVEGHPTPPEGIRVMALAEPESHLRMGQFRDKSKVASPAVRAFSELLEKEDGLLVAQ